MSRAAASSQSGAVASAWPTGHCRVGLLIAPVVALLAVAVEWPALADEPLFATVNALVPIAFYVNGALLLGEPGQSGTGRALILFSLFFCVGWFDLWGVGPMPLLAEVLGPLALACGAWALLRYPNPRLQHRHERVYVVATFVWLTGVQAVLAPVSRPEWHGYSPSAWWPTVVALPGIYSVSRTLLELGEALLAAGFVLMLLLRVRHRGGLDGRLSLPVLMASALGGAAVGAEAVGLSLALPRDRMHQIFTAGALVLLLIPAAFLVSLVWRRLARAAVADLLLRVARPSTADSVREALRDALHDPDLDVLYWLPDRQAYVDGRGLPVGQAAAGGDRLVIAVDTPDGKPLAVVLTEPTLARHRGLLDAATAACGLALENARLHAVVRAQRLEAPAGGPPASDADVTARLQVERDLHDGAQQQLLALSARLALARMTAVDPTTADAIDAARRDLTLALRELRDLAQGIHPAVLRQSGLAPALEEVAERLPLPIVLDVLPQRLPPAVEATVYFIVCEALANVVKHAGAGQATVRVRAAAGECLVEIADDGVGGADAGRGRGLAGLIERVRAQGGELTVTSAPCRTLVAARIPCA